MGAEFTIEGTAFDTLGYDATHGQVLDLALEDATGLDAPRVVYSVVATSDDAPALTFSPSTGIPTTPTGTVTVTMPGSGAHSYRIQCQVNEGRDSTGRTNREYTKERIVALRSANLDLRKLVPGETTQYSATGWTEEQNSAVDAIDAGSGGGGGTTEDVDATADTLLLRGSAGEGRVSRIETPIVRTATNGDIELQHGSTAFARFRSTTAPEQARDLYVDADGVLWVWSTFWGARTPVLKEIEQQREYRGRFDGGAASMSERALSFPDGFSEAMVVTWAQWVPEGNLPANGTNFSRIVLSYFDGAPVESMTVTTEITGFSALTPRSLATISPGSDVIPAGRFLIWSIEGVGGAPPTCPAGTLFVRMVRQAAWAP